MRKRAVKFITVFVPSLVLVVACPLLGIRSEAASTPSFGAFPASQVVSDTYGAVGIDNCVTVSFPTMVEGAAYDGEYSFYLAFAPRYESLGDSCEFYYDNVRMVIGAHTYAASYQGNGYYLVQGRFEYDYAGNPHCSILFDVHRIGKKQYTEQVLSTSVVSRTSYEGKIVPIGTLPTYSAEIKGFDSLKFKKFNYTALGMEGYEGYLGSLNINGSFTGSLPDLYVSGIKSTATDDGIISGSVLNEAAYLPGGTLYLGFTPSSSYIRYLGQDERTLLQNQTQQQHSDAQNQLDESKKQTDAMTKFDGKSGMDKNSSDLNSSLTGFDSAQQSIFESSSTAINNFDFGNLFSFPININSAIVVWNSLMTSIVASMGDFSLIYTISMGLVFISIIVGIWRYFVK